MEDLGKHFRFLLDRRGLTIGKRDHDERYELRLDGGTIAVDRHPRHVREAVQIARDVYGEGYGEHGELMRLYARRDELETPDSDQRVIAWVPHTADGPGLNPSKWVRLDAWLDGIRPGACP